jgi:hypothetical protein
MQGDLLRAGIPGPDDAVLIEQKNRVVFDVRYKFGEVLLHFEKRERFLLLGLRHGGRLVGVVSGRIVQCAPRAGLSCKFRSKGRRRAVATLRPL